jgi:hypothetical protein
MTLINPLCTLAEVKNWLTTRSTSQYQKVDPTDDANIEKLIQGVSDYFNDQCRRTFYPRYEKRYYDVPVYQNSPRNLFLDDDLLEVVTITNGDTTTISSTVYNLKPKNISPHYAIQIIGPAAIFWIFNGIGSIEKVISVEGWWGYHSRYEQRAWTQVGTLAAAITDTTSTALSLSSGHLLTPNRIIKVGTEIMNVATLTALNIQSSTNVAPIHIITTAAHGFSGGEQVTIAGHLLNTNANGTWVIGYVSTTEFTLVGSVGNAAGGNTGTVSSSTLAGTFSVNQRGDNGSTAATHLVNAPVYAWNVEPAVNMAVLQTVQNMYSTEGGQPGAGRISITAAGVVIRPQDVPDSAQKTIQSYTRPL